jgi:hypothetical protein
MRDSPVRLVPWSAEDLPLLRRLHTPGMRQHVGARGSDEQMAARHQRYRAPDGGRTFRVELTAGEAAGGVAFTSRLWHGVPVYQSGWNAMQQFPARGAATAAIRASIPAARTDGRYRWLRCRHAARGLRGANRALPHGRLRARGRTRL